MKVLVVDDDADILDSTVQLLEVIGHEARAVADVDDVPSLAGEFQPDVILQDVNMPNIDLPALVAAERQACPGVRVILFTASKAGQELVHSTAADDLLSKPFAVPDLMAVLGIT